MPRFNTPTKFLAPVVVLWMVLVPQAARAGVWVQGAISALDATDDATGTELGDLRFLTTATAGFEFPQGFVLALEGLASRTSSTGDHTWAWGPKGGLLLKGFEATAAYLPVASDYRGSSFRSGGGFALTAGYSIKAFGPVRVGLLATYLSLTFDHADGQVLPVKQHSTRFAPQLSLAFDF